ncbi:MAG: hypothetical protein EDM74_06905 [Armatimonadetes bacterium]|nr:MAG: hypothetical protein EDM74_06905 [Armatimonadota bacterium]
MINVQSGTECGSQFTGEIEVPINDSRRGYLSLDVTILVGFFGHDDIKDIRPGEAISNDRGRDD